jgi:Protein of unknown function (DUF1064).
MSKAEIDAAIAGMNAKRSKYGVDTSAKGKEARTYKGILYASKHEMEVFRDWVEPQERMGLITNVQRQVGFDLHAATPGGFSVKVGVYKADWTAQDRQGRLLVIEAKGMATPLWKRNLAHFEAEYGLRITVL